MKERVGGAGRAEGRSEENSSSRKWKREARTCGRANSPVVVVVVVVGGDKRGELKAENPKGNT